MTFEVYEMVCLGILWIGSIIVAFILGSTHEVNKSIKAKYTVMLDGREFGRTVRSVINRKGED